jgi:hypothetical protein
MNECKRYLDRQQVALAQLQADMDSQPKEAERPKVVCLCGSTRFGEAFQKANLELTVGGIIVLSIGCNLRSDTEIFSQYDASELHALKVRLDELHKRKIDLCDSVMVLNIGGYIGSSTRSEIEYAKAHGKPIQYFEAISDTGETRCEKKLMSRRYWRKTLIAVALNQMG